MQEKLQVGEGYRLLAVGETYRADDEAFRGGADASIEAPTEDGDVLTIRAT